MDCSAAKYLFCIAIICTVLRATVVKESLGEFCAVAVVAMWQAAIRKEQM